MTVTQIVKSVNNTYLMLQVEIGLVIVGKHSLKIA